MMDSKKTSALIFGRNDYSLKIVQNIVHKYPDVHIFELDEDMIEKSDELYEVNSFDLSDDWEDFKSTYDMQKSIAFCVLENDAKNIFLTISLRASFSDLTIIALSKNKESANKLTMAGANKVIPLVQTTADIIVEMLNKPIITDVLHNILYETSDLKIAQIKVENHSYFDGKYPSDVEWSKKHGVIVLSIMHEDMSTEFIYSSKAKHHAIKNGDIFIVVGYAKDIEEFEKLIGSRCDVDWSHRSR